MRTKRILLASPTMHGEEMKYIQEAFDTNWIAPLGKNVDSFEQEICDYIGGGYAAALTSCTAALHMALKLCKLKRDEVVLCSDLTFSASVNPVSYEGGRQVFIDSDYETWNMDPAALEKAFEKYPEARVVIVANLYGTPARLNEIRAICDEHHAVLIEDAAESLSATCCGRQTGTFGDYNALSFNGNKIITSSGGGMLLSRDEAAVKKVRFWATQAKDPAPYYQHSEIGYNYRMSNIVAGIGRGQLLHLEEHRKLKKEIYERYRNAFAELPLTMNPHLACSEPNYWLSCILLDKEVSVDPFEIMKRLDAHNIDSRPTWKPMHLQPVFADRDFITVNDLPVSEEIFSRGLCLPSDIKMTEDEQNEVIAIVKSFF